VINLKDGKEIKRRVNLSMDNRIEPRKSDYGIMTILPDGYIAFKQRGKDEIVISIESVYRMAIARSVAVSMDGKKVRRTKISRGLLSTFGVK
jgi:hypothetical protein